jgi:hypothetical protein
VAKSCQKKWNFHSQNLFTPQLRPGWRQVIELVA